MNILRFRYFITPILLVVLIMGIFLYFLRIKKSDFQCPDKYASRAESIAAIKKYAGDIVEKNPDITLQDFIKIRYEQLVASECKQAILNINKYEQISTSTESKESKSLPDVIYEMEVGTTTAGK